MTTVPTSDAVMSAEEFRNAVRNACSVLELERVEVIGLDADLRALISEASSVFAYQGFDPRLLRSRWFEAATKKGRDAVYDLVITSLMVLVMGTNLSKQKTGLTPSALAIASDLYRVYSISDMSRSKLGENVRVSMTLNRFSHVFPDVVAQTIACMPDTFEPTGVVTELPRCLCFPGAASLIPGEVMSPDVVADFRAFEARFNSVINKAGRKPGSRQDDAAKGTEVDWLDLSFRSTLFDDNERQDIIQKLMRIDPIGLSKWAIQKRILRAEHEPLLASSTHQAGPEIAEPAAASSPVTAERVLPVTPPPAVQAAPEGRSGGPSGKKGKK